MEKIGKEVARRKKKPLTAAEIGLKVGKVLGQSNGQFLSNSKGSCGEVKSHLYVALDQAYITSACFDQLYGQASEVGRLLSGFMTYLRESNLRGRKYR